MTATLVGVGGLLTALCLLLLVGLSRTDAAIQARTGKATAQVLSVSWDRTVVRYTTPDGNVHTPEDGVLYPEGLATGELVRVEYDTAHPETVRVAERSVTLAFLPVGMTIAGVWIVVLPIVWRVRRRTPAPDRKPARERPDA